MIEQVGDRVGDVGVSSVLHVDPLEDFVESLRPLLGRQGDEGPQRPQRDAWGPRLCRKVIFSERDRFRDDSLLPGGVMDAARQLQRSRQKAHPFHRAPRRVSGQRQKRVTGGSCGEVRVGFPLSLPKKVAEPGLYSRVVDPVECFPPCGNAIVGEVTERGRELPPVASHHRPERPPSALAAGAETLMQSVVEGEYKRPQPLVLALRVVRPQHRLDRQPGVRVGYRATNPVEDLIIDRHAMRL